MIYDVTCRTRKVGLDVASTEQHEVHDTEYEPGTYCYERMIHAVQKHCKNQKFNVAVKYELQPPPHIYQTGLIRMETAATQDAYLGIQATAVALQLAHRCVSPLLLKRLGS